MFRFQNIRTFDTVQSMINLWRNRPMVKNSDPPQPITKNTARHHIAELLRFFRWLNRTCQFDWRKPEDFDELQTGVSETPKEVQNRMLPSQVQTYSIDELKLINEYATPLERVLFLLGLNCGFGAAEQGQLVLKSLFLNQTHPHADLIKKVYDYESTPHDSFILGPRPKNRVYGEFILWKQTVDVLKWARARRENIGDARPDSLLLVSKNGKPFFRQTAGGNRAQRFSRIWSDLTKRIQADHSDFPSLSFGKLRKTAGDLVRQNANGEIASVFLCHGRPVSTDALLDIYTNRPFGKVITAIKALEERLQPIFRTAPSDLFKQPTQQYTTLSKEKQAVRLYHDGQSIRNIAKAVGVSKSTIHRIIDRNRVVEKPDAEMQN